MKICFLCSEYPPAPHGGIGTFVRNLAGGLQNLGHEIWVVGLYRRPHDEPRLERADGIHVVRLAMPGGPLAAFLKSRVLYSHVGALIRERGIELVEAVDWAGLTALWPQIGVPLVLRIHGGHAYTVGEIGGRVRSYQWWCERRSVKRATHLCAVSAYVGERLMSGFKFKRPKPEVIYNGVAIRSFVPMGERDKTEVVFSGTLVTKKGVLSLARAWREVGKECPLATLHVYGKDGVGPDGTPMSETMRQLAGQAAAGSIVFHGHVSWEVLSVALDRARLAVFPSFSEAFSLAPLEAMAGGCPTIFTRRTSGPEAIVDGRDGLLVDPAEPGQVAKAILSILNNDALGRKLGRGGYERVAEEFSLETAVEVNEAFFKKCIAEF